MRKMKRVVSVSEGAFCSFRGQSGCLGGNVLYRACSIHSVTVLFEERGERRPKEKRGEGKRGGSISLHNKIRCSGDVHATLRPNTNAKG